MNLSGGNSNIFHVHPEKLGKMNIFFHQHILQMGGKQPPTTSSCNKIQIQLCSSSLHAKNWWTWSHIYTLEVKPTIKKIVP